MIVWKLDRWGRSVSDVTTTLEELTALGVSFVSINEALDFTTPIGKAMSGLLAVFAELERDFLRERFIAGIEEAKSWVEKFVVWYNFAHRHSEINFVTPISKHTGKDFEVLQGRVRIYERARAINPQRFSHFFQSTLNCFQR